MSRRVVPGAFVGRLAIAAAALALMVVRAPELSSAQLRPAEPDPGDLLIATRELDDPNFAETVVLLLHTGPDGAGGVVLNRPTPVRVATVMPQIEALSGRSDTLRWGGPVEPEAALLLVRLEEPPPEGEHVVDDVYVVRTRAGIEELLRRGLPETSLRVFAGYAGWTTGQLEWELERGSWHLRRGDAAKIFDDDVAGLWERLVKIARSPTA